MPSAGTTHLILGTAGHVDHGKTELVRYLTGIDTDRLKEEKERGISIELGFAPLQLGEGVFLGVIDVPGHERFVRQMVAGAGGIDLAMLLIAGDESVMPQTKEHLEVLRSLRVKRGLVVISKSDLADEEMLILVRDDIAELVRGTFLEDAPVVETSAKTGAGIDELRDTLLSLAGSMPPRDTTGPFRLAIDRVFHQKGIGVVVTGSCYTGSVSRGDALWVLPSEHAVRVRELQSFGEKRESGHAGERLALALQGIKLDEVHRGDMLTTPEHFCATSVMDARFRLADYDTFELKNRERVRVHHGAREVLARVILLETDKLRAGEETLVQLRLESPLVPARGDSIVVRKYSPARVAGGGVVIDPSPERHKRFDTDALDRVRVREKGDPREVLLGQLKQAGAAGIAETDVDEAVGRALVDSGDAAHVGDLMFASEALDDLFRRARRLVEDHTSSNTLSWGLDKEELRQKLSFRHSAPVFNKVLDHLSKGEALFVRGNRVRVGSPDLELSAKSAAGIRQLDAAIARRGAAFGSRKELAAEWSGDEAFHDVVTLLKDNGRVVELGDEALIHSDALESWLDALRGLFERQKEVGVADLKEVIGLSRKYTIPMLEYLDSQRITTRSGDYRVKGPAFPE